LQTALELLYWGFNRYGFSIEQISLVSGA